MKVRNSHRIEIMAVGSELLTPYYQDTNSLYLAGRLDELGMEVSYKTIVGDEWDELVLCIRHALARAEILIAIGGLGPTRDDRTREAFASVLERKLVFRQDLLRKIESRFKRRGLQMPPVNKKQAYVFEGAEVLENKNGTAPGLWLDTGPQLIILLPGPPQELRPIFESSVWPRLEKLRKNFTARRALKITGLTESKVETLILDLYPRKPHLSLTTLAYPGQIEIHLRGCSEESQSKAEEEVNRLARKIMTRLGEDVFSGDGAELEEVVGNLLRSSKKTLAVAESCTGGFVGHRLTNIPGSSDYFLGGIVVYSNEAKIKLLGVSQDLIEKCGAVSAEVATAMAVGIREKTRSSLGLAVTGIAGPAGGTPEKPVGLVYTAIAWETGSSSTKNLFLGNREMVKFQSAQRALDMVRRHLLTGEKRKRK